MVLNNQIMKKQTMNMKLQHNFDNEKKFIQNRVQCFEVIPEEARKKKTLKKARH